MISLNANMNENMSKDSESAWPIRALLGTLYQLLYSCPPNDVNSFNFILATQQNGPQWRPRSGVSSPMLYHAASILTVGQLIKILAEKSAFSYTGAFQALLQFSAAVKLIACKS